MGITSLAYAEGNSEGGEIMKGKLFRRYANGCIYEVIGQVGSAGPTSKWILWNERFGERLVVSGPELSRQVGWDLVGTSDASAADDKPAREMPAALMK
jgi:hypothetical protein